jgi:hypothetical protein
MTQPAPRASDESDLLQIRDRGGPTSVIEIGGLRLVTDPPSIPLATTRSATGP